ncbi:hypothetical protein MTO96_023288 [Rhipicephalus appendiculatus]
MKAEKGVLVAGAQFRFFLSSVVRRYLRFARSFILADESNAGTQHEDKRRATIGAAKGDHPGRECGRLRRFLEAALGRPDGAMGPTMRHKRSPVTERCRKGTPGRRLDSEWTARVASALKMKRKATTSRINAVTDSPGVTLFVATSCYIGQEPIHAIHDQLWFSCFRTV